MPHTPRTPSPKRPLPRGKRRKSQADPQAPQLPAPWAHALARVKRHIQAGSRHHSQAQ